MQSIPDALDKDGSRQYAGRPTRWDLTNQADICTQGEGWWGKGGGSGSQGTGYRPFMCICVQGVHVCAGYRVLRLQHDCMTTDDDRVSTSQGEGVHITG